MKWFWVGFAVVMAILAVLSIGNAVQTADPILSAVRLNGSLTLVVLANMFVVLAVLEERADG